MSVITITYPKARKQYRCYLCHQPIPVGEVHERRSGIDDEGAFTCRGHDECWEATKGWTDEDWEYADLPIERPAKPPVDQTL